MDRTYSTKKLDLTGQRFGKLIVVEAADNIGNRTAWRCHCDCGNDTVVKTVHLRDGHTKSCGCTAPLNRLTFVDGTCVEMIRANTIRSSNRSGAVGVHWDTRKQLWRASICFKGRRYYLGRYEKFSDAVTARKRAEAELHDAFLKEFDLREKKSR